MSNEEYIKEKLKEKEWSMGNGQCPTCGGMEPGFNSNLLSYNKFDCGHTDSCETAFIMENLGMKVDRVKPSVCVSAVCSCCGIDLMDENNWKNSLDCAGCGAHLFMRVKREYKEILNESI